MVPQALHAAACWEQDYKGKRGAEAFMEDQSPQTAGEGASGSGSLL